jgi:hypothetical protein
VLGCGIAVASLWSTWAVDGPHEGSKPAQNGWATMAIGDVLLVLACAVVLLVAVAVVVSPAPMRVAVAVVGGVALVTLLACAAGVGLVWFLLGWNFIVMDADDLREYGRGTGEAWTLSGLGLAFLGFVALLAVRSARLPR